MMTAIAILVVFLLVFLSGFGIGFAWKMQQDIVFAKESPDVGTSSNNAPVHISVPVKAIQEKLENAQSADVDMDGLILTESGGNPIAQADPKYNKDGTFSGYLSKGLCQISKAAWTDVCEFMDISGLYPYDSYWQDPAINRMIAHYYINKVIPQRYFYTWNAFDSVEARIAAYKCGPGRWYQIYLEHGAEWRKHVPKTVKCDLIKYAVYVKLKAEKDKT